MIITNKMQLDLFDPETDLEHIKLIWQKLSETQTISYFLSWGWIENWIKSLANSANIKLSVIAQNGTPIGAFFLGQNVIVRKNIIRIKQIVLNETGIPTFDSLHIEYNLIPHNKKVKFSLNEILKLIPIQWDEFYLRALDYNSFPGDCSTDDLSKYTITKHIVSSAYVDLEKLRNKNFDYLSLLKSKTRTNIRKAFRFYEDKGSVICEYPKDLESCLSFFDELVKLNIDTLKSKGKKGGFMTNYFINFHRQLMHQRYHTGEIQLLRITVAGELIGLTYGFIYNNSFYGYQMGINYEFNKGKNTSPGIVCQVEAIIHNAKLGRERYDFLGGGDPWKLRLATDINELVWIKIQKKQIKFFIERGLTKLKESFLTSKTV